MKLIILLSLILALNDLYAQWEKTSWQSDPQIGVRCVSGDTLIISEGRPSHPKFPYDGHKISTDKGNTWEKIDFGQLPRVSASSVLIYGSNLYFGGNGYLYVSTDFGETWENRYNGMPSHPRINILKEHNGNLWAGTYDGIFMSSNFGKTWIQKNNGLGKTLLIVNLAFIDDNIIALAYEDIFLSEDYGDNWQSIQGELPNYFFQEIITPDNYIFVATQIHAFDGRNYLYSSSDMGRTWVEKNDELIKSSNGFRLITDGERIYLKEDDSLYVSVDLCETWVNKHKNLPAQLQKAVTSIAVSNGNLYAVSGTELYYSSDKGDSWTARIKSTNYAIVNDLYVIGDRIFAATSEFPPFTTFSDGIFVSEDMGASWEGIGKDNRKVLAISSIDNIILATKLNDFLISSDYGNTWESRNEGLPNDHIILPIEVTDNVIVVRNSTKDSSNIYISKDYGNTWNIKNNGFHNTSIFSFAAYGNSLYAGLDSSFYVSDDLGDNWYERSNGLPDTIACISSTLVNGNDIYIASKNGVFYSSDQGKNWVSRTKGLPENSMRSEMISSGDMIFIGVERYGVYFSSDKGENWKQINKGLLNLYVHTFAIMDGYIFVGTYSHILGKSGDAIYKAKISDLITDIEDNEKKSEIKLFPNPAADYIEIQGIKQSNIKNDSDIRIYNYLGELVIRYKVTSFSGRIDVSFLPVGVYFVKYSDKKMIFVKK